jgi:hypothetical protein
VGLVGDGEAAAHLERGASLIHAEDDPVWGATMTAGVWLLKRRPDDRPLDG